MALPEIGTLLAGRYRLIAALGEGAMGFVYRAEQLDAAGEVLREVAVKTLQPALCHDESFGQRFLRETRVTARLSNPHVVTVFEAGRSDDGQLFYSMELVPGRTLKEVLVADGPMAPMRAAELARQILDALAEAHEPPEPIVHRDLKPANVFVQERRGREWVKVADFGIAKVLGEDTDSLTQTGLSPGTPRYMAPEQWRGTSVDGRADLYALGAMLYEMLVGAPPFTSVEGPQALMYQHLHEAPPELPASVPEDLARVVRALLEKAPERRPANAERAIELIDGVLRKRDAASTERLPSARDDEATENIEVATQTSSPQSASPPAGRGFLRWLVVAVVILALGVGFRWLRSKRSPRPTPPAAVVATPPSTAPTAASPTVAPPTVAPSTAAARTAPTPAAPSVDVGGDRWRRQLAAAAAHFDAQRLTSPPGRNAVAVYREILASDPQNRAAHAGLEAVAQRYLGWARRAVERRDFASARGNLAKGLAVAAPGGAVAREIRQLVERLKAGAAEAPAPASPERRDPPATPTEATVRRPDPRPFQRFFRGLVALQRRRGGAAPLGSRARHLDCSESCTQAASCRSDSLSDPSPFCDPACASIDEEIRYPSYAHCLRDCRELNVNFCDCFCRPWQ